MSFRKAKGLQNYFSVLFFAIFICLFVGCQSNVKTDNNTITDRSKNNKNFLWKVQSKTNTVYLFGSIHVGSKEMVPLNNTIVSAIRNSKVVAGEVNVDEVDPKQMIQSSVYPNNGKLKDHISERTYKLVQKYVEENGFKMKLFERFKTWTLAFFIVYNELEKNGFYEEFGIDNQVRSIAKKYKKKIIGLESIEYHLGIFDRVDDRTQELFLNYYIKDIDGITESVYQYVEAWQNGDEKKFEKLFYEDLDETPDLKPLNDILIIERNNLMFNKIERILSQNEVHFVVVGAGHLVGETGLLNRLRQKGYLLQQM